MKKTSVAAVNRILNGKSNDHGKSGFWCKDKETGKIGVTDSYCCVVYDHNVDLSEFDLAHSPYLEGNNLESPFPTNVSDLFKPFNDEFHEWYSDDRMENIAVKEIINTAKETKKNKNEDSAWYRQEKFGIHFNINLMRDVCEALDCKEVGIYYPYSVYEKKYMKPIVIIGENGMGLVMQIHY